MLQAMPEKKIENFFELASSFAVPTIPKNSKNMLEYAGIIPK